MVMRVCILLCVLVCGAYGDDTLCPTLSSPSTPDGNCTCRAMATGPDGGNCSLCAAGKYKTAPGSEACTDVVCGPGFEMVNQTCALCKAGSFSETGAECVSCEAGKFSGDTTETIGAEWLGAWGALGIMRWVAGRVGQSCDDVCASTAMSCAAGDMFPQTVSPITTGIFLSMEKVYCHRMLDSTDPSAPFSDAPDAIAAAVPFEYASTTTCYRGVGISTCSAHNSLYARLCPCGDFGNLRSRFTKWVYSYHVTSAKLATWAASGIRDWKFSGNEQSCDSTAMVV